MRTSYLLKMSQWMIKVILSLCFDKLVAYFFVLFNAYVIYSNILFQLFDNYCLLFCRYRHICWGWASPTRWGDGGGFREPIKHKPIMPHRSDVKVCTELVDHIYDLFVLEGVPYAHVRNIIWDLHVFDIWCTLPYDMTSLMHRVVGALMLIQSLRACIQSKSSYEDVVPGASHHDSPLAHALVEQSTSPLFFPLGLLVEWLTSPHSPPHAPLDAPFTDWPTLLIDLSPRPNPLVLVDAPSINIHPPPPLHVLQATSSTNPPPPPPPFPLHVSRSSSTSSTCITSVVVH